ncbi:hypothetical protein ACA910_022339 [Epithemia clementina (nom. ined.)]
MRGNGGGKQLQMEDQEEHVYVATCLPGLSSLLAQELMDLGAQAVDTTTTGNAACRFRANLRTILHILIQARIPHKVMEFLCESPPTLQTRDNVYQFVRETIPVKQVLGDGRGGMLTLCIVSTILNNPTYIPQDINHSHYTALTIKNALCDAVRDLRPDGLRPDVDKDNPDLPLVAVLRGIKISDDLGRRPRNDNNRADDSFYGNQDDGSRTAQLSLYRQIHNGSLHKRGYRSPSAPVHKAAMKESLAAGLLLHSGWLQKCRQYKQQQQYNNNGNTPNPIPSPLVLVDPMAGSGTLVLEALFMAANVAPHVLRLKCGLEPRVAQQYPPITRWKHNDINEDDGDGVVDVVALWKELLLQASGQAKDGLQWLRATTNRSDRTSTEETLPIVFLANDAHPGALSLLQDSLDRAGVNDLVEIFQGDCREFQPPASLTTLSSTPPLSWTVVCNPPWGVRLLETNHHQDVEHPWQALGHFLHDICPNGSEAHVLSGNPKSTRHLGLRRTSSLPIQIGNVQMRWITYPISNDYFKNNTQTNGDNIYNSNMSGNNAKSTYNVKDIVTGVDIDSDDEDQLFSSSMSDGHRQRPTSFQGAKRSVVLNPESTRNEWMID